MTPSTIALRIIIYATLIILAVFFLIPFYLVLMSTLRGPDNFHTGPIFFLPEKIHFWANWHFWVHGGFQTSAGITSATESLESQAASLKETWLGLIAFGNSFFYGISGALGAIGVASLAAYALSKIRFRGYYLLFLLIISMMFFPPHIFLLPFIIMMKAIGLYNTRLGLILIYIGLGTPFATFLLRNYFLTIHTEIIESARLDGASEARIWSRIVMPLAKPALAVTFIFLFTFTMSDYLFAAALTTDVHSRPMIPFVVDAFILHVNSARAKPIATVGALLITIPIILVFLFFQRYFIRGLLLGSVKR